MKIIIAGSRNAFINDDLPKAIELSGFAISEVVCGGCRGPDTAGEVWAHANRIPCVLFYAEWNRLGKRAGLVRNIAMADYSDGLIAFWDGKSAGTKHMIDAMKKRGKPVCVHSV